MLSAKVHYSISHHKTTQSMWNALQMLHEDTNVKESRIKMLTEEYELFRMELGEVVESMHTCFLHLIHELENLDAYISNKECANKIFEIGV